METPASTDKSHDGEVSFSFDKPPVVRKDALDSVIEPAPSFAEQLRTSSSGANADVTETGISPEDLQKAAADPAVLKILNECPNVPIGGFYSTAKKWKKEETLRKTMVQQSDNKPTEEEQLGYNRLAQGQSIRDFGSTLRKVAPIEDYLSSLLPTPSAPGWGSMDGLGLPAPAFASAAPAPAATPDEPADLPQPQFAARISHPGSEKQDEATGDHSKSAEISMHGDMEVVDMPRASPKPGAGLPMPEIQEEEEEEDEDDGGDDAGGPEEGEAGEAAAAADNDAAAAAAKASNLLATYRFAEVGG